MDFKPSPEVETLRERILDFMDAEIYPQEREIMEALDAEVAPGVPYPEDPGRDPREGEGRGPLEPLHARRALRPRADQLGVRAALRGDGPQPGGGADGLQLRRAGHRQHGDPRRARHRRAEGKVAGAAARGPDPLLLLDDRARGLRLGPDPAAGARRPRRRRVGDRRPQVVHLRRRRRRAGDRDGRHRPRRPPLRARLDDLRADRRPRLQPGAADPGDGPRQGPRPLRDPLRRMPRPRRQPARRARARASSSPRTASAPAASTTACGRSAPPSGRWR